MVCGCVGSIASAVTVPNTPLRLSLAPRQLAPPFVLFRDDANPGTYIDGLRVLRINRERLDVQTGQARVGGSPALAAVGALEDPAAVGPCVDRLRVERIDRERWNIEEVRDSSPAAAAIRALEDTVRGAGVHGLRISQVDHDRLDRTALRPVGRAPDPNSGPVQALSRERSLLHHQVMQPDPRRQA